jgi:hypothetical protein
MNSFLSPVIFYFCIAYNGFMKEKECFMTNYDLMNLLILSKDKSQLMHLLKKYRISIDKSKYC